MPVRENNVAALAESALPLWLFPISFQTVAWAVSCSLLGLGVPAVLCFLSRSRCGQRMTLPLILEVPSECLWMFDGQFLAVAASGSLNEGFETANAFLWVGRQEFLSPFFQSNWGRSQSFGDWGHSSSLPQSLSP